MVSLASPGPRIAATCSANCSAGWLHRLGGAAAAIATPGSPISMATTPHRRGSAFVGREKNRSISLISVIFLRVLRLRGLYRLALRQAVRAFNRFGRERSARYYFTWKL